MKHFSVRALFAAIACAAFFVPAGLFAQERAVLTNAKVQNFIKNYDTISRTLTDMAGSKESIEVIEKTVAFMNSIMMYFENDGDFEDVQSSYRVAKNAGIPAIKKIFNDNIGQDGYSVFLVLTLGLMIAEIEDTLEAYKTQPGQDPEEETMMNDFGLKLAKIQTLVHPGDLKIFKNRREAIESLGN